MWVVHDEEKRKSISSCFLKEWKRNQPLSRKSKGKIRKFFERIFLWVLEKLRVFPFCFWKKLWIVVFHFLEEVIDLFSFEKIIKISLFEKVMYWFFFSFGFIKLNSGAINPSGICFVGVSAIFNKLDYKFFVLIHHYSKKLKQIPFG